jgi:hypothetical protein
MMVKQWWNDGWQGKSKELGEKPVTVPFDPPEISQEATWD